MCVLLHCVTGNLPPHSDADADKHRDEVQRMSKLYDVKLQREAGGKASKSREDLPKKRADDKVRRIKAQKGIEREQRLEEAAQIWVKQILPQWEQKKLLPSKAKDLVWSVGVPPRVRGKI